MYLKVLLSGMILCLLSFNGWAGSTAPMRDDGIYSYESFAGGRIEIRNEGAVIFGDFGVKATICGSHSNYFCVNASRAFYFAVPKHFSDTDRSWTVYGHKYELVSAIRWMMVIGNVIPVAIISTTDRAHNGDTATRYFYYSPKIGLIAFEDRLKVLPGNPARKSYKSPDLYVLNENIGFGANN